MRRSWDRGQVEPLAALAAVLAVSAAVVVYVGALGDATPPAPASETPSTIRERVETRLTTAGVTDPDRLAGAMSAVPDGWTANVTLVASGKRWSRGPTPPERASRTRGRVTVGTGPKRLQPGQLRVVVWQ